MIIKLHGETSLNKLPKILKEVITDIQNRAGIDESKFTIKDAEIGILFNVNGEKMYLTVEHDGLKEIFNVHVELDEKGNIKTKKDNEEESFVDEYSRAVAKGLENPVTKEIESVYNDEFLKEVSRNDVGDLVEIQYIEILTGETVYRYYRNGVLIGEVGHKNQKN